MALRLCVSTAAFPDIRRPGGYGGADIRVGVVCRHVYGVVIGAIVVSVGALLSRSWSMSQLRQAGCDGLCASCKRSTQKVVVRCADSDLGFGNRLVSWRWRFL